MPNPSLRTNDAGQDFLPVGRIFEQYADTVFRLAFARTKHQQNAEDIVQEVFLKYIKAQPRFQSAEHCKAWLLRVTLNCSKNLLGSAWVRHFAALPDTLTQQLRQESQVYGQVLALPAKYRTVIHLFYYEGYSVEEIGQLTGTKSSTVKSQLHRARKMLRISMEGENEYV